MDTPRACPNLGADCEFPDCTFLDAECAAANAEPAESAVVEQTPSPAPRLPYELPAMFPITADDIFKKQ